MTPQEQLQPQNSPQLDPDLLNAAYSPSIRKTVRGGDRLQGVKPELLDHWNSLQDEFTKARLTPEIKSGFRTAAQQNALFRNPATAAKTKGHDGYVSISPHQRGEALDISFPASQRAKGRSIIADYAKRNGLKIPSDEPWHLGLSPQVQPALDPDLLNAGRGQSASTETAPQLDPDLMKAAYGEQPKTEKITSEVKPLEFQGETPQPISDQSLPQVKPIEFNQSNAIPRKAQPIDLAIMPFEQPEPTGSAVEQLTQQRYKTPPSTELSQAVKIPFSSHLNPTEDDLVKGYLNALGPEYAKYGEKYKQETGRNILSLQAGDVDRDPDGSAFVKPTRAAVDVLNAYVKSGGDINAAKAEGARIAAERRGAVTTAEQQAAPDIAEVEAGRRGLGTYSGTERAIESPIIRYGGGKIQQIGGLVNVLGIAPNTVGNYLNTRGKIMELGSSLPPLTPQGEELKRSVPEKVGTALGDLGLGVFDIIAMKRATGLSAGQVMALEAALKDSDKPLPQRGLEVAKAYTLGRILDGHLNRAMSSAMFAVPAGVEGVHGALNVPPEKQREVMLDALLNTAVQGGMGAILGGGKESAPEEVSRATSEPTGDLRAQTEPNIPTSPESPTMAEGAQPEEVHYSNFQPRRQRTTEGGNRGQFRVGKPERPEVALPDLPELSNSAPKEIREARQRLTNPAQTDVMQPSEPATPIESASGSLQREAAPVTTSTPEPQIVRPWEMTRDQIEEELQRKKAEDDNLEASILGPELAKRYAQLQRSANSSYDIERANRASDEIQKIEASLSERDRNRLYGIGEEGPQVDELRDYRQSLGNLDDHDPQSLAESMRWAVSRVGNETDPAKMTHEQRVAYGTLREAARIAYENGWDTQAISREAVRAAGARFADPEDARFMLNRFLKKEPQAPTVERKQIAAPQEAPMTAETKTVFAKAPNDVVVSVAGGYTRDVSGVWRDPDGGLMEHPENIAALERRAASAIRSAIPQTPVEAVASQSVEAQNTSRDAINPAIKAAQEANAQRAPEIRPPRSPKSPVVTGKKTTVRVPGSQRTYEANYAVRELDDVVSSNNPQNFQPNPDYYHVNDRKYEDEPQYQTQIINRSRSTGPEPFAAGHLINNSITADSGPPIIDSDGNVLGGNSRSMILSRVYKGDAKAAESYRQVLKEQASVYGINPKSIDAMKQPVLVREIDSTRNLAKPEIQKAITELNIPSTTPLTREEQGASSKISEGAADFISRRIESSGEDATLSQVMDSHGAEIINRLIDDGAITAGERNTLIKNGDVTPEGKARVERVLTGRLYSDLDQLKATPTSVRANIERAAPALLRTEGTDWDIIPTFRRAVDAATEARSAKMPLDELQRQVSMVHEPFTNEEIAIAKALSLGPRKAVEAFRKYAGEYQNAKEGGGLFGSMTQAEAFDNAFNKPEPEIVSKARARIEKGKQLKTEGVEYRGSGGPDTQVLLDHLLVHGYDAYQSGKVKFEDWSAEMRSRFKDFKDEIEPHLKAIYDRVVGRSPESETQTEVKPSTAGIAQRVEESRRSTLNKESPQTGQGITAQDSVKRGRELLAEGKNPDDATADFKRTGAISSDAMALVRARHEELARAANKAFDEGRQNLNDPKFKAAEQARQEFWEKSVKPMQTEWAKTGMAQQGETDIDTGTFYGLYRAFKDSHSREPSPKEQGILKDLSAKSARAESDVQNVTGRLAAELDKAADIQDLPSEIRTAVKRFIDQSARESRRGGRQQTRKTLDEEAATIRTNLAAAFQKVKSDIANPQKLGVGLARIDPEGEITKQLIAYAKNRAKAGITDASQLIDDVHSAVKDFADVTKREVAEAILGAGLPKKERSQSEWAKIKSSVREEVKDYTTQEARDSLGARLQGIKKADPKDAAEVWKYARENYVDKGNNDFADVTQKVASDLGITPDQVRRSLANTAATKRASDEMWKKMADRRQAKQNAESWVRQEDSSFAAKAFENARRLFFLKATAGHGFVAPFTHAPANVFIPSRWAQFWPNFGRTYQFLFSKGAHEQKITDLERSPNYIPAKRGGLANDPKRGYDEYQSPWMAKTLGKLGISGNRAFDSLKTMRQDLFDSAWHRMPEADRTPEMAKIISEEINSSTGASKALTGKDWPSRFASKAMFAAPLEASRWEFLVRDNARAIQSFANWKKASPEARYMAKRVAARNAQLVATYGSLLAMNQGLLTATGSKDKVNFTDPTKADFLAFKIAGHAVSPASGMLTAIRFIGTLASQAKNADLKKPAQTVEDMAKTTFKYGRSKLSPLFSTGADVALRSDYGGRPLPFSQQKGTEERPRYTWLEYLLSQQTPIPIGEGVRDVYHTMREQGMGEGQAKSLLKALAKSIPVTAVAATGIRMGQSYPPSDEQQRKSGVQSFQDRFMQGKITEDDLDRAAKKSELTQSEIDSILKEKDLVSEYNPSQLAFYKSPTLTRDKTSTSLDRFERMTARMRMEVQDIMQEKADAILDSNALTEVQKKAFADRIKRVGLLARGWKEGQ